MKQERLKLSTKETVVAIATKLMVEYYAQFTVAMARQVGLSTQLLVISKSYATRALTSTLVIREPSVADVRCCRKARYELLFFTGAGMKCD